MSFFWACPPALVDSCWHCGLTPASSSHLDCRTKASKLQSCRSRGCIEHVSSSYFKVSNEQLLAAIMATLSYPLDSEFSSLSCNYHNKATSICNTHQEKKHKIYVYVDSKNQLNLQTLSFPRTAQLVCYRTARKLSHRLNRQVTFNKTLGSHQNHKLGSRIYLTGATGSSNPNTECNDFTLRLVAKREQ